MDVISNYIDGKLIPSFSNELLENRNPATGDIYAQLPNSNDQDVDASMQAARKALHDWQTMDIEKRSSILLSLADLMEENADALAMAESIDNGKPLSLAQSLDIPRAISNIRFFATAAIHFSGESHTSDKTLNYTVRSPVGIAGCISPWNLPLYLLTWKIAPALSVGCTVVAKPSELTPMTAFLFSSLCIQVGIPPGVLNIVHGYGHTVGQAIVSHPQTAAISFTGGTKTGQTIANSVAGSFKKLSLEMGGKNPNIIFSDCDLQEAVKTSIKSSFTNQGEVCLCGSRILIEQSIFEEFASNFVKAASMLKVGDPLDAETNIGAIISVAHLNKIRSYVELAKKEGGEILLGGTTIQIEGRCAKGNFMAPTIITGLKNNCSVNQEEIFGPVVTLIPFETEEEAIAMANDTTYGLSASIWTKNIQRGHRVANSLECGMVWINCWLIRDLRTPFGGVKNSGVGREGGWEALRFFTNAKNICTVWS